MCVRRVSVRSLLEGVRAGGGGTVGGTHAFDAAGVRTLWLRSFGRAADGRRIVCFPHAGGGASAYRAFAVALAPELDVVAVQYPGRHDRFREPAASSIAELADVVAGLLAEERGPLALFGHSMGALVAFEVARRLEASSRGAVDVLVASGRRSPSSPLVERIHRLEDSELIAELQHLSGTQALLLQDPEIASAFLPVIRADSAALASYRCDRGAVVSCPIVAFVGADDPYVPLAEAEGWRAHTTASFELRIFAGGHFFLNDNADVVEALLDVVRGAQRRTM